MGFVVLLVALVLLLFPFASFLYSFLAFRRLEERIRRLEAAEGRRSGAPAVRPPPAAIEPSPPIPARAPVVPPPPMPAPESRPVAPPVPPRVPVAPGAAVSGPPPLRAPAAPRRDLEREIGTRWMVYAGAIVLVLGLGFFLKYAFENQWIGPAGRVALGVLAGVAMLAASEAARRRAYRAFSQGLAGGGIATLYLSVYGASGFYHLIPATAAFLLMAGITAAGMLLAVLQEAAAIAVLALLGGIITPVLLSTGRDSAEALFVYLALLDLGALGAVAVRRWRLIGLLAFGGTIFLYAGWFERFYRPERLGVALIGILAFVFIFLIVPALSPAARRAAASPDALVLPVVAGLATFGFAWRMLHVDHRNGLAFLTLLLSAAYLGLMALRRKFGEPDRKMESVHQLMAIAFLTLAIPVRLGLHGITLAWAAEGVVLIAVGLRQKAPLVRWGGVAALGLAVIRVFARHLPLHAALFRPVINAPFGTVLGVCVALGVGAWLLGTRRRAGEPGGAACALANLGGLLLVFLLTQETAEYGRHAGAALGQVAAYSLSVRAALLVLWGTAGLGFLIASRAFADKVSRLLGFVLLAAAAIWSILPVGGPEVVRPLFLNRSFLAAVFIVICLLAAIRLQPDPEGPSTGATGGAGRALGAAAAVVLLILLTEEVSRYFGPGTGPAEDFARRTWRAQMAVTVTWVVYAVSLLAVGFRRRIVPLRYGAFGLLGLCVLKAIVIDMAEVRQIYRVVSLLALGLVLVGVSYVYHRWSVRAGGEGK